MDGGYAYPDNIMLQGEETIVPVDTFGAHNAQMHKLGVSARSEDPE